jgi:xanthine dehydrogenase accessory factor
MNVWEFIHEKLYDGSKVMLMYVLNSEGSSPGRQGFKMALAEDGTYCGTIGGGIMEHKFVEKAKLLLKQNETKVLLQKQYHDKNHGDNQSGMICSGSQLNVLIPLSASDIKTSINIFASRGKTIQITAAGIGVIQGNAKGLQYKDDENWVYTEAIDQRRVIHIIGGGHIGLALSEIMSFLGFFVKVYDDRPGLKTLLQNDFADEKIIIPGYDQLDNFFTAEENDFVVIMTVGYRTDKVVLKQLIDKQFSYLGLLGSKHKIETLFNELKKEGIAQKSLGKVFSPVGLNIESKTTKEIAVSIAAEIIREKNKELPALRQSS